MEDSKTYKEILSTIMEDGYFVGEQYVVLHSKNTYLDIETHNGYRDDDFHVVIPRYIDLFTEDNIKVITSDLGIAIERFMKLEGIE